MLYTFYIRYNNSSGGGGGGGREAVGLQRISIYIYTQNNVKLER